MGVRTRGLGMQASFRRAAADRTTRAEPVIQRWNDQLASCKGTVVRAAAGLAALR
jgi:hypothetical protein